MAKIIKRDDVIKTLRKMQSGRTDKDLAIELGISPVYLCDIFKGKRDPGKAILSKLKLQKVSAYISTE